MVNKMSGSEKVNRGTQEHNSPLVACKKSFKKYFFHVITFQHHYDIWRHIWGHNDVLALQKVEIYIIILTPPSCSSYENMYPYKYMERVVLHVFLPLGETLRGNSLTFEWNFGLPYEIWRHIWRHNHVLAFIKSKYKYSDTTIAFLGWKYVSIQVFSSIRSFVGILTFEWRFWLFHDIWRHIWRHNVVLPLQKAKMS